MLNKFLSLLIMFLAGSCAKKGESDKPPLVPLRSILEAKVAKYSEFSMNERDQYGFILSKDCDSTLFTGLYNTVPGLGVELLAARNSDGQWFRRPLVDGKDTCYPHHSASTISRDMLLGVLWSAWRNKDLSMAEDLWNYGVSHDWNMGQGDFSRTFFTTRMQGILAELIYRLGGTDHKNARAYVSITKPLILDFRRGNKGFQAHLDVLSILLYSEMRGFIKVDDKRILSIHNKRSSRNALFSYAYRKYTDGDYSVAVSLLLNPELFPDDRLPNKGDHKEPWLWQRDDGDDWLPHKDPSRHSEIHPGGDFLFVANLILSEL